MTDQKTKIKDFYMSRDKSELCNHKPKANKQEKKKNVRPSIQPKRRNERLQSPGKSYDLGLKTRGDQGLLWLPWPGHIYSVGMEYSYGSCPSFYLLLQYLCITLDFKLLCFGKVRLRCCNQDPPPLPWSFPEVLATTYLLS